MPERGGYGTSTRLEGRAAGGHAALVGAVAVMIVGLALAGRIATAPSAAPPPSGVQPSPLASAADARSAAPAHPPASSDGIGPVDPLTAPFAPMAALVTVARLSLDDADIVHALPSGTHLAVLAAQSRADRPGYLVEAVPFSDGLARDGSLVVGWIGAEDLERGARRAARPCPAGRSVTPESLLRLAPYERLLCFSNQPLTVGPGVLVAASGIPRVAGLATASSPGVGLAIWTASSVDPRLLGRTVVVHGHYGDASGPDCAPLAFLLPCTERLVVTAVEPLGPVGPDPR